MKINEDRKSLQKEVDECNLQHNLLESQLSNREDKIANMMAAEQKYKDNQIAYKTSLNASDTRIKELEKKNRNLKIKGRFAGIAAIILPILALVL